MSLAKIRRWPKIGLLLSQRRGRWANIEPALGQRLMFAESLIFTSIINYKHAELSVLSRGISTEPATLATAKSEPQAHAEHVREMVNLNYSYVKYAGHTLVVTCINVFNRTCITVFNRTCINVFKRTCINVCWTSIHLFELAYMLSELP